MMDAIEDEGDDSMSDRTSVEMGLGVGMIYASLKKFESLSP